MISKPHKNKCKCKDTCICDYDISQSIINASIRIESNCSCIFECCIYDNKFVFSKKDGWKIFSLNKENDEEIPIIILRIKNNRLYTTFFSKDITLKYELMDKITYNGKTLNFQFNYLNYEII